MSSPKQDNETVSSSADAVSNGGSSGGGADGATEAKEFRPPAKRPAPAVIEISDTESDDSDICAVTSYQASADEVKRIRGDADDDYSSSSSSDYSSDSDSPWEDDSVIIKEEKDRGKAIRRQLNPRANRTDDPQLNPKIKSQELIDEVTSQWREMKDHKTSEITLTSSPFRLCLLHNFLKNPEIINNIVDDMNTLDWSRKKMDLYEFHQTADLATLTWQRSIRGIYELLKTEVMSWVSGVTGLTLHSVSASCSLYGPGDHLLVHDDLLGDRRVAFILYLAPWGQAAAAAAAAAAVTASATSATSALSNGDTIVLEEEYPGWSSSMGGSLQLVGREGEGPTKVAHEVTPANNMLAFFQVGTDSFHQVEEVLSLELPRLSINGWFHGPGSPADCGDSAGTKGAGEGTVGTVGTAGDEETPPPTAGIKPHQNVVVLSEWVSTSYMSPRNRCQIQTQMESESEVCLRDFLLQEKYEQLVAALDSPETQWEWCGPSNWRHYERLVCPGDTGVAGSTEGDAGVPGSTGGAAGLLGLVSSSAFLRMLADCTDLTLTTYQRLELQRWRPGDYTLLPLREMYQEARLEMVMYLRVPQRPICGGGTTYVAPEEAPGAPLPPGAPGGPPGALVTVPPVSNALSLVYCDPGAASFTKYLSRLTMDRDDYFYILTCMYKE